MSGEYDRCSEHCLECRCNPEHHCEIPGWRCYGNDPIVLDVQIELKSYRMICTRTEVNYCPFCGLSPTIVDLARGNNG